MTLIVLDTFLLHNCNGRNIFGKEIKNEVVLLIHFEQIASFLQLSIPIQTQYSY